ncbi:hypothetical protein DESC_310098 [Desulfosarcina cetonica]|nr:hypothetical protein DESC_310098 [Desulfosarcina cetonica]
MAKDCRRIGMENRSGGSGAVGHVEGHHHQSGDQAEEEKEGLFFVHGVRQGAARTLDFGVDGKKGQAHNQPEDNDGQDQRLGVHRSVLLQGWWIESPF